MSSLMDMGKMFCCRDGERVVSVTFGRPGSLGLRLSIFEYHMEGSESVFVFLKMKIPSPSASA